MLLIVPTSGLPACAVYGCSLVFLGDNDTVALGQRIWEQAISDANPAGPVAIGAREFESLRIESGQVAFRHEMTALHADAKTENKSKDDDTSTLTTKPDSEATPATPLELHLLETTIDTRKGCYLGQEGIASILKNPRGAPRILYQVVFADEFNMYDYQLTSDDASGTPNQMQIPRVGDKLYVLGSNEEIAAGILTSLAEPGSTGEPNTVGLALIRRADSILKQMKDRDLDIPSIDGKVIIADIGDRDIGRFGVIAPPPLDPLDGLEVKVSGSFTVGTLRVVPRRRLREGQILFDETIDFEGDNMDDAGSVMAWNLPPISDRFAVESVGAIDAEQARSKGSGDRANSEDDDAVNSVAALEAAAKASVQADELAAEAARKAEKMELLRKRAEDAMARRTQKNQSQ
jgi:hypothetical protein